jgi:hypothetical protein
MVYRWMFCNGEAGMRYGVWAGCDTERREVLRAMKGLWLHLLYNESLTGYA